MKHIISFLFLLALTLCPLRAQRFSVDAPTSVGEGKYFHLRYTAGGDDATGFTPPSLADFEVLAGPNVSHNHNFEMINGRTSSSSSVTYTYVLMPRRTGTFTIGPASVRLKGRTLQSRSVSIHVGKGGSRQTTAPQSRPQVQKAGSPVTERDLYITASPSRTKVYEQEAVLVTYKIHIRNGVGLSNIALTQKPDFKGLVSQELPRRPFSPTYEGNSRVGVVQQYLLFPQKAGRIEVPGLSFDCTVMQEQGFNDPIDAFFNSGGAIGVKVSRRVAPQSINVSALPEPKPANYSGAVGNLRIAGKLIGGVPRSNDVATYRITISGTGNLKMITAPAVAFPSDFDAYQPKSTDRTEVTADGISGQMEFDYTFVPRNVGQYTIPATEFCFFNPETGHYETLRTEPQPINVARGTRSDGDVERDLALRKSDIRPIIGGETRSVDLRAPFFWGSVGYWSLCTLVLVLALFAYRFLAVRIRVGADVVGSRRRKAGRMARKHLSRAEKLVGSDGAAFYDALSEALHGYLADKFNLPLSEMSSERIVALLEEAGATSETRDGLQSVIDECEFARFAPSAAQHPRRELFDSAAAVIDTIEKEFAVRPASRDSNSSDMKPLLTLLLALALSLPAAAQKLQADSAYAAKNYSEAAALYEKAVAHEPSAAVFYNNGNAHFRLKNYPKAIVCYERALRLDPSSADTRHNLALCRTKIQDNFPAASEMFFITWTRQLRDTLGPDGWAMCALLCLVLCLICFGAYLLARRVLLRKAGFFSALLFLALCIGANAFAASQRVQYFAVQKAVVLRDAPLFDGSGQTARKLRDLHAGTTVVVEDSLRSRLRVALPNDSIGWIEAANLERV